MDNSMKNKKEGCPKIAPNFVNRLIEDMHLIKGPFLMFNDYCEVEDFSNPLD